MKKIFLLLLLPVFGYAQMTDTTCIQSRWIACKPIDANHSMFPFAKDSIEKHDMVHLIKELVELKKMKIYSRNEGRDNTKGWSFIDYNSEIEERKKDSLIWDKDPYFEISVQSDMPLVDEYGDPVIRLTDDGFQEFVYPPAEVYVFATIECAEVHIKEERFVNDATNEIEFRPVGLSFYFKGSEYSRGKERFWIDLDEFFNVLENKESHPWYNLIIERKYQGFQYMQTSCYDLEIKD